LRRTPRYLGVWGGDRKAFTNNPEITSVISIHASLLTGAIRRSLTKRVDVKMTHVIGKEHRFTSPQGELGSMKKRVIPFSCLIKHVNLYEKR